MITSDLRLLSYPLVCKVAKEHSRVGAESPVAPRRRHRLDLAAHRDDVVLALRHTRSNAFWPCGTPGRFYWPYGTQDQVRCSPECHKTRFILARRATRPERTTMSSPAISQSRPDYFPVNPRRGTSSYRPRCHGYRQGLRRRPWRGSAAPERYTDLVLRIRPVRGGLSHPNSVYLGRAPRATSSRRYGEENQMTFR
jgi:hypothetical protein